MADRNAVLTNIQTDDAGAPVKLKLHDNGDGSYSLTTYGAGGGGGGSTLVYNATPPTLTDGQTVTTYQVDNKGRLLVNPAPSSQANDSIQSWLYDASGVGINTISGGLPVIGATATGATVPTTAHYVGIQNGANLTGLGAFSTIADNNGGGAAAAMAQYVANNTAGTTVDKVRNTISGTSHAPSSTASATVSFTTFNARFLVVLINITAFTSGSLAVTVNGRSANLYTYPLLVASTLSATGLTVLRIGPGLTPSANAVSNDVVPRTVQIVATVTGTLSYGIDYILGV